LEQAPLDSLHYLKLVSPNSTYPIQPSAPGNLAAWPFLLLIVTLPIVSPFNLRFSGLVVPIADLFFVVAACAWLVDLIRKRAKIVWSWFYLPLGLYLAVLLLSTLASENPRLSAVKLAGKIYLTGLAVLSFNLVRSAGFMRRVVTAWQVGTIVTVIGSMAGIILFYLGLRNRSLNLVLHGYGSLPRGNYPRIEGFFEFPAMLCNYLSVSLMLALLMWWAKWLSTRWVCLICAGILITAFFTFTPGLGGLPLSLGIWLWLYFKEHGRVTPARINLGRVALIAGFILALAVFAAAAVTLFSYSRNGTESPLAAREIKPSHRAMAWQTAFETFKQHPILGRGVGMDVSSATYTNPSGRRETLTDAHNTYLSVAGESGLLGFLGLAAIIVFVFYSAREPTESGRRRGFLPLQLRGPLNSVIKTYLILALIDAFFYQSLVGSFEDTRHLWVVVGMLAAFGEQSTKTHEGNEICYVDH
jgi:putative inorganic carbon (hco3(-)) transporter